MNRQVRNNPKVMWMLGALLVSYVMTGILLILLTFLVYKFELNEKLVSASIVAVYVLATLAGGMTIGKIAKVKRFLWGITLGVTYFAILFLITLGVYKTLGSDSANLVTTFILCAGGGMIGGMLS